MNIEIMTLFPEMVMNGVNTSITGRAIKNGYMSVNAVNIRDYSLSKHGQVDDYPYGGGAGMVMMPEPIDRCYQDIVTKLGYDENGYKEGKRIPCIYMSPQGRTFNQKIAKELSEYEDIVLLCGHYEGVDQRILDMIVTDEISIGDYVLTGGELAAMVITDAVSRLIPGVLNNDDSAVYESFHSGLLEYPQYTRPAEYKGVKVPDIILSGDHKKVEEWRYEESVKRTRLKRPDMLENREEDVNAWEGSIKY